MRAGKKDYYEILGVPRNATKEEIDAAFAKLAMKWHPDRVPHEMKEEAERKFKEISEAYAILSDPQKREMYDRGIDPESGAYDTGFDFSQMNLEEIFQRFFGEDIFETFFGGRREGFENPDIHVEVELNLEEVIKGTEKTISYTRKIRCDGCKGEGIVDARTCHTCMGTGRVRRANRTFIGFFYVDTVCETCRGKGVVGKACHRCGGKGFVWEKVNRSFKIPAGVLDGQKVIYKNWGHFNVGRLVIHIKEKPHPKFERRGKDIVYKMEIEPPLAVLGGEGEFEHITGEKIRVKIPQGVQNGEVFARFRGKGIEGGDLLVYVVIKVPKSLSKEEKELYRRLLELSRRRDED